MHASLSLETTSAGESNRPAHKTEETTLSRKRGPSERPYARPARRKLQVIARMSDGAKYCREIADELERAVDRRQRGCEAPVRHGTALALAREPAPTDLASACERSRA